MTIQKDLLKSVRKDKLTISQIDEMTMLLTDGKNLYQLPMKWNKDHFMLLHRRVQRLEGIISQMINRPKNTQATNNISPIGVKEGQKVDRADDVMKKMKSGEIKTVKK